MKIQPLNRTEPLIGKFIMIPRRGMYIYEIVELLTPWYYTLENTSTHALINFNLNVEHVLEIIN